ncbi:metal ABC transporter solute-binding protein, Zn/Mn family [Haloferula rosea]|uniref:Zinc ABC transporter substrate-binding protein n=1 Tax=Haloferula rosea TaxID=490093 RepID=A0A934RC84_9BACT|nr:zinc ABC transporter substrate-binding protein [Haloferula rosea]MBK1825951.1 zinc ABC transporter substrate-binding protein [Haloferula rosea]
MQLPKCSLLASAVGILASLSTACDSPAPTTANDPSAPIRVTATIGMIGDIVERIGGDHVQVETLIGEGVDPHLYKPTSKDVKALIASDLVFYNGLKLEGKMGDVLERVGAKGKPVKAVTEAILDQKDYLIEDGEDHYDPHVWMDVRGWMRGVDVIADTLSEVRPEHAQDFNLNREDLLEELRVLDDYAFSALASIPADQRVLVTAHDAFGYMAKAYGLEVIGIQGISTESEAGVHDLTRLVEMIVERKIPAVFVESSVSDKNVRALIEGAAAAGHTVAIGGELFSDAMGKAGTYEGTYEGMIDHNVTTITRALGGSAPEKGYRGELGTP